MKEEPTPAAGVQALIDRLRDQGVESGRREAEQLLEEARKQAQGILSRAAISAEAKAAEA